MFSVEHETVNDICWNLSKPFKSTTTINQHKAMYNHDPVTVTDSSWSLSFENVKVGLKCESKSTVPKQIFTVKR